MNILCYTYEADYHCIECTVKRYKANRFYRPTKDNQYFTFEHGKYLIYDEWNQTHFDENDISYDCFDNEGNELHPLFTTDEWYELDESYLSENPIQYLTCGTCQEVIDTYEHEPQEPDTFGFSRAINWEVVNNLSNDELEKLFN